MSRSDQATSSGRARMLVAAAFWVTMFGATLPTPLYPIYERELGFGGFVVTLIFATYAVGVLAALLLVGRLSDAVGRKRVLLPGMAVAAASSLVFLIPGSLTALFVGRLLSGISAGVFTAVATATLVDLADERHRGRAGLQAAVANMLGLGSGPLISGALAEFAPLPVQLPYLVHVAALLVTGSGLLIGVPETVTRQPGPVRLTVQRLGVPDSVRPTFVRAATAGFAGFAVLGFFTAVSPLFVGQVLHRTSLLLIGVVSFALLGAATAGQVVSARLAERVALQGGCLVLVAGIAVFAVGISLASLTGVLVGAVIAGLGLGAAFRAGLQAVTGAAPAARRSEVSSSYFLVLYTAISLPVVGVGAVAQWIGLVRTALVFSGLVAVIALAAFAGLVRLQRRGAAPG